MGNIKKNYIYSFLSSASFQEAIWMLFLAWRGMSLIQIGLLESIFHVTSLICEVPTGYIADRFGRRTSRILSRVSAFTSCILMLSAHSFTMFAISFVFTALSYNLESGAGDALIYDSLVESGHEGEFMKIKGKQEISYQSARIFSLVAGGLIATFSYTLAYSLTAILHFSSFIFAFSFKEPTISKMEGNVSFFSHMRDSMKAVWANKKVLRYIFYMEGFSLLFTTLYFYFQNYLKSIGYVEYQIGLVLGISAGMSIVSATLAYRIEKRMGERGLILLASPVSIMLFGMIALTRLEPLAMVLISGVEGILYVVFSDYINKRIPSRHRATILSFEAMVFSVMMIVFFPVIGVISERSGFKTAFALIAVIALIITAISTALMLFKDKRLEKTEE